MATALMCGCVDRNRYILPVLWFMAGFSRAVPSVALRILMVNELKVQPAQQATLGVAGGLPWVGAFVIDSQKFSGRSLRCVGRWSYRAGRCSDML